MIDGCTLRLYFDNLELIHKDKKFGFESYNLDINSYKTKYRGLHIELLYNSRCCVIHGSIHKFKNYGETNKDLFTVTQLIDTLKELYEDLHMKECSKIEFSSIEFGLNIQLPYNPKKFINNIIHLDGFEHMKGGIKFVSKGNYEFKIYSGIIPKKAIPQGANSITYTAMKYILRFEVKIRKSEKLQQIMAKNYFPQINKISDIIDIGVLRILGKSILEEFDELMILDRKAIDDSKFNKKDKILFDNGCNPEYWNSYTSKNNNRDSTRKKIKRDMAKFKQLLDDNSTMKRDVYSLLKKAFDDAINITEIDVEKFKLWINEKPDIYLKKVGSKLSNNETEIKIITHRKIAKKNILNEIIHITKEEVLTITKTSKMSDLYCLDKGAEADKNGYCLICKLKLFLNESRGKFLSAKEVEYYYYNYRNTYYLELYPRLPKQWRIVPLKTQFKEIAHAIRNEDSNQRNNRKRRNRVKKDPRQISINFERGI